MNPSTITNLPNGHQIRNHIFNHLRQQPPAPPGWQQTTALAERVNSVFTLYSQLHLLLPTDPVRCLGIAHNFEDQAFRQQPSKNQYSSALSSKQEQIAQSRRKNIENGMQLGNMTPVGMMPPNGMQNPMAGQAPAQGAAFNPQLQRPMQATPLPQNPQNAYAQGMQAGGMSSVPQPTGQNLRPQQHSFSENEMQQINVLAQQKAQSMPLEDRNRVIQSMSQQQRDHAQKTGMNPIFMLCRSQVVKQLVQRKAHQQQNHNIPAPGHSVMPGMGGMQGPQSGFGRPPQTSTNQAPSNDYQESQDVNVAHIRGQQADAQKSQEAGHLVVPASNNPNVPPQMAAQQSVGGQNQIAPPQAFNSQQFNSQQNAMRAQQARNQQQVKMAQARNMSLQGQVGGLNGSQPPQQSPAMPNLNRPMVPPSSNTPQLRPQQNGPSPMESRMSQQGQMGFPNQQGPGPVQNGLNNMQMNRAALIPQNIAVSMKRKLLTMPEPQFRNTLRAMQQAARNTSNQMAGQSQFVGQPGRPQMQHNPLQQPLTGSGQPQNVGPVQRQQPQPGHGNKPLSQLQQAFQNDPDKILEWDSKPMPHQLRTKIPSLPDAAQTWGQVKSFVANSPLGPTFQAHILNAQSQYFETVIANHRARQAAGMNNVGPAGNMANQNAMSMAAKNPMSMAANGPAPPAPMVAPGQQQVPPQANMGMQPQMPTNLSVSDMDASAISTRDLEAVRRHYGSKVAGMTDHSLRLMMAKIKKQTSQQNYVTAQNPTFPMHQQQNLGPNLVQQALPQAVLHPPQPQPQPTQTPKPQIKPSQAPTKPPQATAAQAVQNQRAQKRTGSSDDVVEVPPPKPTKPNGAPNMQQSKSQQGIAKMTADPMANLKPQDTAKFQEQMRQQAMAKVSANASKQQNQTIGVSAPVASSNGSDVDKVRLSRVTKLMKEIYDSITTNSTAKVLRPEQIQRLLATLKKHQRNLEVAPKYSYQYYAKTADESLTRQVLQPVLLAKALTGGIPANKLLATPEELERAMEAMTQSLKFMQQKLASIAPQDKPVQPQTSTQDALPESQNQLNAANLRAHQDEENMARQRSLHKRSNSKTPSAPVSAQPPHQLGASSPHGAPVYNGPNDLTSDKLKLPPNKRRKTQAGSAASTPGQPTPGPISSPQVTKSPDIKRGSAPEPTKPAAFKNIFKCQHDDCDPKTRAFETEQELNKHVTEMHPVIDDPLSFAIKSVGEADGCNPDGSLKRPAPGSTPKKTQNKGIPTNKTRTMGATPNSAAAATPMARSTTQPGAQASPSKTTQNQSQIKTLGTGSGAPVTKSAPIKSNTVDEEPGTAPPSSVSPRLQALLEPSLDDCEYDENDPSLLACLSYFTQVDREQRAAEAEKAKKATKATTVSPPQKTPELSSPSGPDDSPQSHKDVAEKSRGPGDDERSLDPSGDIVMDYEKPELPSDPFPPFVLGLDLYNPGKESQKMPSIEEIYDDELAGYLREAVREMSRPKEEDDSLPSNFVKHLL